MTDKPRVLVVEDEPAIRTGICDLLAFHGLAPTPIDNGTDGLREALAGGYDLLLLDVMLPGVDGVSICRQVRQVRPGQAILMLTARGREEDILTGFEAGCDDYVSKPFSIGQLVARVKALLRRAGSSPDRTLRIGGMELDVDALIVRGQSGEVCISTRDAEVLTYLHAHRGQVVRREQLLREVWGYQRVEAVQTRCVDMHMVKLRRKLARAIGTETVIATIRGAGYRLATEGRPE